MIKENIIMKMKHGSYLYGTHTENSDIDFKGIYLPTLDNYILGNFKKVIDKGIKISDTLKNTNEDVDYQLFSLNYFLDLCIRGDTLAIDCIHSPEDWEDITSDIWKDLKSKRKMFYTKSLKSFLGYCKVQANKYSLKGSRLDCSKRIIDWTDDIIKNNEKSTSKGIKIKYFIEKFPRDIEYFKYTEVLDENSEIDSNKSFIKIFEKMFHLNDYIEDINKSVKSFYETFGQRAELAKENKGIDYKAISHAFRAGFQLKEIFLTNDLIYPLKDREFLLNVKQGKYHYINDGIGVKLDSLIEEVNSLSEKSNFPENCDSAYWDSWILDVVKDNVW